MLLNILDTNNDLPSELKGKTGPNNSDGFGNEIGKYYLVKSRDSLVFKMGLDLWPVYLDKSTSYKIQLEYVSNGYFKKEFINAKESDNNLQESMLFQNKLRSNICLLPYTSVQ